MQQSFHKLYILPFDHRRSFIKLFDCDENQLTQEVVSLLSDYKQIIYEGFLKAVDMGVSKKSAAILIDEQFGAKILEQAKEAGVTRLLTVEKAGADEFDFEYGNKFREHIDKFQPEFVKALVHYNAEGDEELNKRQRNKLKILNDFCQPKNYNFLVELLALPTKEQLKRYGGQENYEKIKRIGIVTQGIKEMHESGIEPNVWKLEGFDEVKQMQAVVNEARAEGRDTVGIVVLGRGEAEKKVEEWLKVGARVDGVIGFAVGRTIFQKPLLLYHQKQIDREKASSLIAEKYKYFVDLFESV